MRWTCYAHSVLADGVLALIDVEFVLLDFADGVFEQIGVSCGRIFVLMFMLCYSTMINFTDGYTMLMDIS